MKHGDMVKSNFFDVPRFKGILSNHDRKVRPTDAYSYTVWAIKDWCVDLPGSAVEAAIFIVFIYGLM